MDFCQASFKRSAGNFDFVRGYDMKVLEQPSFNLSFSSLCFRGRFLGLVDGLGFVLDLVGLGWWIALILLFRTDLLDMIHESNSMAHCLLEAALLFSPPSIYIATVSL